MPAEMHSAVQVEGARAKVLGDFTADRRMLELSAMALVLGLAGAGLAWALLRLIYAATNLFYFHRFSWKFASPGANHLGWLAVFVPIVGGLIVGVIARFGSEKIRGHGIPEALEAILINGAKIEPSIAVLKPLASAIAIGSGGPFGAEGPIIMTAGSVGSLLGQLFRLSDAERTTMLVAGASAGMAGVFGTPIAAVLLAVELMLFEWRPRSLVPVVVASVTAGLLRRPLLGTAALFPMPAMHGQLTGEAALLAVPFGIVCGLLAAVLSRAVYASEDFFDRIHVHWMWWPAIGGVVVGICGLIFPRSLGTGYDVIGGFVAGPAAWSVIIGVLLVKSVSWAFSLGSGTSGGIMAPLLMIGAALGSAASHVLPAIQVGGWAMVGMAAVFSGAIGCPLTAAMMSVEMTHNYGLLVPVLIGAVAAHAVTVLAQKRSILTERLARRGYHVSREYGVDPLETMTVAQVMRANIIVLPADLTPEMVEGRLRHRTKSGLIKQKSQRLYPVIGPDGSLVGAISRHGLTEFAKTAHSGEASPELPYTHVTVTHPGDTLRSLAEKMASEEIYTLPVVERGSNKVVGMIRVEDMLAARVRAHQRETNQIRVRRLRMPFGRPRTEEPQTNAELETGRP